MKPVMAAMLRRENHFPPWSSKAEDTENLRINRRIFTEWADQHASTQQADAIRRQANATIINLYDQFDEKWGCYET
jgi:hypothetical protein